MLTVDRFFNLILLLAAMLSGVAFIGGLSAIVLSFCEGDPPLVPLYAPFLAALFGIGLVLLRRAVVFVDPASAELGE